MPSIKPILRRLARAMYPVGTERRVWRGPLAGARFIVQDAMGVSFALGRDSFNFRFFEGKLGAGDRVFDVGANCGQMALLFARLVGPTGQVLAFEPVPRNASLLRRNLALNHCPNVQVFEMAVGRHGGRAAFNFEEAHHTMGSLVGFSAAGIHLQETIEVVCDTLDHISAQSGIVPSWIKIDVEGGGAEVIAGAAGLLTEHAPDIYFEMHATTRGCAEFLGLLELRDRFGYQIRMLDGRPAPDPPPGWGTAYWLTRPRESR